MRCHETIYCCVAVSFTHPAIYLSMFYTFLNILLRIFVIRLISLELIITELRFCPAKHFEIFDKRSTIRATLLEFSKRTEDPFEKFPACRSKVLNTYFDVLLVRLLDYSTTLQLILLCHAISN